MDRALCEHASAENRSVQRLLSPAPGFPNSRLMDSSTRRTVRMRTACPVVVEGSVGDHSPYAIAGRFEVLAHGPTVAVGVELVRYRSCGSMYCEWDGVQERVRGGRLD